MKKQKTIFDLLFQLNDIFTKLLNNQIIKVSIAVLMIIMIDTFTLIAQDYKAMQFSPELNKTLKNLPLKTKGIFGETYKLTNGDSFIVMERSINNRESYVNGIYTFNNGTSVFSDFESDQNGNIVLHFTTALLDKTSKIISGSEIWMIGYNKQRPLNTHEILKIQPLIYAITKKYNALIEYLQVCNCNLEVYGEKDTWGTQSIFSKNLIDIYSNLRLNQQKILISKLDISHIVELLDELSLHKPEMIKEFELKLYEAIINNQYWAESNIKTDSKEALKYFETCSNACNAFIKYYPKSINISKVKDIKSDMRFSPMLVEKKPCKISMICYGNDYRDKPTAVFLVETYKGEKKSLSFETYDNKVKTTNSPSGECNNSVINNTIASSKFERYKNYATRENMREYASYILSNDEYNCPYGFSFQN